MSCGDTSGLPDLIHAPFDDEQVEVMARYQKEGRFHPYTCCNHQTMVMTHDGLKCPKCGVVQNWVLRNTLRMMIRG